MIRRLAHGRRQQVRLQQALGARSFWLGLKPVHTEPKCCTVTKVWHGMASLYARAKCKFLETMMYNCDRIQTVARESGLGKAVAGGEAGTLCHCRWTVCANTAENSSVAGNQPLDTKAVF